MFLEVLGKLLNTRAYSRYLVFGRTHVFFVAHEILGTAVVRVISPPCSFAAEKRRERREERREREKKKVKVRKSERGREKERERERERKLFCVLFSYLVCLLARAATTT